VKLDRYGIETLGRERDLSHTEAWVLLTLVLRADFRTWKWEGTLSELASDALASRNTVTKAVVQLWERGIVVTIMPFGRNSRGVLFVTVYDDLVVPELRAGVAPEIAHNCANPSPTDRAAFAHHSRSKRAVNAQSCANATALTSGDAQPRSREAAKESGGDARGRAEHGGAVALMKHAFAAIVDDEFEECSCGERANENGWCSLCAPF
jgi:DNA-binding MarR family transcriptional regulator